MADVEAVGDITAAAWRDRLVGILPSPVLESLRGDDLALVWAGSLVNPPTPLHRLLVAVEGDDVVGYAAVGPSPDPDADAGTAELLALEVDPAHQRAGHGSRLLGACVDVARSAGADTLTVWCPLVDEVRRAFLQSAGWGPDTALRDLATGDPDDADGLLREARLVTDIRAT
ncbi:MAG TPA: GNAT family N-acetyltransferase [Actinobacteria bacterium]|nr:GNAT family N-acetyltransferase [Actinomycetota bacterium]